MDKAELIDAFEIALRSTIQNDLNNIGNKLDVLNENQANDIRLGEKGSKSGRYSYGGTFGGYKGDEYKKHPIASFINTIPFMDFGAHIHAINELDKQLEENQKATERLNKEQEKIQDKLDNIAGATKAEKKSNADKERDDALEDLQREIQEFRDRISAGEDINDIRKDIANRMNVVGGTFSSNGGGAGNNGFKIHSDKVQIIAQNATLLSSSTPELDKMLDEMSKDVSISNQQNALSEISQLESFQKRKIEGNYFDVEDAYNTLDNIELEKKSLKDSLKGLKGQAFATGIQGAENFMQEGYHTLQQGTDGIASQLDKTGSKLLEFGSLFGPVGAIIGGFADALLKVGAKSLQEWSKADQAASAYARKIGGGSGAYISSRNRIIDFAKSRRPTEGITFEETASALTNYQSSMGRAVGMSQKDMSSAVYLNRMGIDSATQAQYNAYGNGVTEIANRTAKIYQEASKKGLAFETVSKKFNENLKAANGYTFSEGLKSLREMAEKSASIGYDLSQAFQFAQKVSTLEGATQSSANLSVLGGTFSQLSNPLAMLNEGLNSVEDLNERMIEMTKGMSYWDASKHQITTSSLDKLRMRGAAEAMGVSYEEMLNISQGQARGQILVNQAKEGGITDKDLLEAIKNRGQLDENGNGKYVTMEGREISLNNMSAKDRFDIQSDYDNAKLTEGKGLEDIYGETMSMDETLKNISKWLDSQLGSFMQFMSDDYADMRKNQIKEKAQKAFNGNSQALAEWNEKYDTNWWLGKGQEWHNNKNQETLNELIAKYSGTVRANERANNERFRPYANGKQGGVVIAKGNNHENGGIPATVNGSPAEIENDETIISANKSSEYDWAIKGIFDGTLRRGSGNSGIVKYGEGFFPAKGLFESLGFNNFNSSNIKNLVQSIVPNNTPKVNGSMSLNVTGTIKLELDGKNVGNINTKELFNNPSVMKQISDEVYRMVEMQLSKGNNLSERLRRGANR